MSLNKDDKNSDQRVISEPLSKPSAQPADKRAETGPLNPARSDKKTGFDPQKLGAQRNRGTRFVNNEKGEGKNIPNKHSFSEGSPESGVTRKPRFDKNDSGTTFNRRKFNPNKENFDQIDSNRTDRFRSEKPNFSRQPRRDFQAKEEFINKDSFLKIVNSEKSPKKTADPKVHGFHGVGRRKESVARVWVKIADRPSSSIVINDLSLESYFTRLAYQVELLRLFKIPGVPKFDAKCLVERGGLTGQVGAIKLGIARALCKYSSELKPLLRSHGLLTRDSRMVLPKVWGRKKSRKMPTFVKR